MNFINKFRRIRAEINKLNTQIHKELNYSKNNTKYKVIKILINIETEFKIDL